MMQVEFTVEPFVAGAPGPHVQAAIAGAGAGGLRVDVGPFGSTVVGEDAEAIAAVTRLIEAATRSGATRVTLDVRRVD